MKVLIPLAPGVEELEAISVVDVLRRGKVEVVTAAVMNSKTVMTAHGVVWQADALWTQIEPDLDSFDAIVLPGGGAGTEALMADKRVISAIKLFNRDEKFVCAICAAPMVLAKAEVLKDREATCYPTCMEALGSSYRDAPVIVDGNIITSQGPGTALLFALVLLCHFVGEPMARQVAGGMLTSF
ncbi:MAG: DJ-1/PfpI family protein [Kiritimatiellae bacterium]|nr:DJ-1/PfpI family protein [Kiritimatiellia bacterium]